MSSNSTTNQTSELAPTESMDIEAARQVEDSKLTRRAALRKLGYGAGFAAFSLLGVDDLARLVGQRLERLSGDSKVAQAVAQEFQSAGIALASATGTGTHLPSDCTGKTVGAWCRDRYTTTAERNQCCNGTLSSGGYCKNADGNDRQTCLDIETCASTCDFNAIGTACSGSSNCTTCVRDRCHQCACGNPSGVPCLGIQAGCNSDCYSTAIGVCSQS